MKNYKIVAMLIVTMFIGLSATSICKAEEIEGSIDVEISQWIGLVTPILNITENQTGLSLKVDKIEGNASANETDTYRVNDTLSIKIRVTDNSERGKIPFLIPRYVFAAVIVINKDAKLPPLIGFFKRYIRAKISPISLNKQGRIPVTDGDTYLNVSMKYTIKNGTTMENMTMHIIVMGLLPGNIDGLEGLPIVSYMKVNLKEVTYVYPE